MTVVKLPLDAVLVPQGAEYRAVRLARLPVPTVAVPVGMAAMTAFLEQFRRDWTGGDRLLLMGLAGSLSPTLSVGEAAIAHSCLTATGDRYTADPVLVRALRDRLKLPSVAAYTSDRLLARAEDKARLHRHTHADLVEMEGAALLREYPRGAVLRAVSDGCTDDLPDLAAAIAPNGKIQPLPVLTAFLGQPRAAGRLIGGSLLGLRSLYRLAIALDEGDRTREPPSRRSSPV